MTDTITAAQQPRLYSETSTDDRGNFHHQGDLHRSGEPLPDIIRRLEHHLATTFADSRFALRGEAFAGGRKIVAEVLDHSGDLTAEADRAAFEVAVRDQIARFGFSVATPDDALALCWEHMARYVIH